MKDKQNLIAGISVLTIAGLICKVVGVLYKIPLARTIGPLGMGVYHQVFPTYNLLLTVSSAGIPVAISRMVAASLAENNTAKAKSIFKNALRILLVLGVIGTFLMVVLSGSLSKAKGTPEAAKSFIAIAPSLFFVCVMSAFRGFMQGRRRMIPTAVSQLIEQVGKVFVAMPFAYIGMQRGGHIEGAAGALLGTSIAEGAALLYMALDYYKNRHGFQAIKGQNNKPIIKELVLTSIPITIGACIVPIASEADSFMLVKLMSRYLPQEEAIIRYGIYVGLVIALINVPTAFAMAVSTNLVPNISAAKQSNDYMALKKHSQTGLKAAAVIGFPASIGMSLLAEPILVILFRGEQYSFAQLSQGAKLLEISSLTIVVFTMVQATSGILQGLGKQRIPMYTLALGVALKILLNQTLVRIPSVNIYGAPFASLLCYIASMIPNLYYVSKYTKAKTDISAVFLRPLAATGAMAVVVLIIKLLLKEKLDDSLFLLGGTILIAMAVYYVAAKKLGCLDEITKRKSA
ncbi:MAG: polysaccharide biosynthesis protein [Eubacteriales bacterium]|nr:polysaccharide biosynthesis protein [Eubacteriales bacterium]